MAPGVHGFFSIDLAFVACLDMAVTVNLYSHPVVAGPQDFIHHGVSTGMCPKGTFMDIHYNSVYFAFVYTSEQYRIIIPFVQHHSEARGNILERITYSNIQQSRDRTLFIPKGKEKYR